MINKHILIVEDAPELQILLTQLFESEGYIALQALNGQQALDILRTMTSLPAFILLDIMMPVMDGFSFREEQMKDTRLANIPVIVMTADSEPQVKAQQLGVNYFFKKPIRDLDKLLQVAENLCA